MFSIAAVLVTVTISLMIGWGIGANQTTTNDLFISGGRRHMNPAQNSSALMLRRNINQQTLRLQAQIMTNRSRAIA